MTPDVSFPRQHARTRRFTLGRARSFQVGSDVVLFLRSPAGDDPVTDLWRLRMALDINTKLLISGLFQYDSLTDQFQTNVRFNYIYTPLSDIFLVYNERRLAEDPSLIDRAVILKVTRLIRL